jgi:hypothetical protein
VRSRGVDEAFRGDGSETYKHLEDREEVLWGLNFVQLLYVTFGALGGIVFALYVSPLAPAPTLFVSILLAGLPVVLSIVATRGDVAPWTMARAAWRWLTGPKRFAPSGSRLTAGYVVTRPEPHVPASPPEDRASRPVLEEVWDL